MPSQTSKRRSAKALLNERGDRISKERVGHILIITGSLLGIIGGVVNALLYHDLAIDIWLFSNLFLLIWAIGYIREWWNKKLSIEYIAIMYAVFTICNFYAVLTR